MNPTELKAAGFSDEEVAGYAIDQRKTLTNAGFSTGEVDTYFGNPPFDPQPIADHIKTNLDAATKGPEPEQITDFMGAIEAGLQISVSGLLTRKDAPSVVVAPDAPRSSRIAASVATLAGDFPFMVGGAVIAGPTGPVTALAGAFALPAGLRKILMDKYTEGEVTTFSEFWDRLSGAVIDTTKGYITGAATGLAGAKAGMALKNASPTVRALGTTAAEIPTMVAVGSALEGHIPNADEFIDAAIVISAAKGATKYAGKLRTIYERTGVRPADVVSDMERDPTIKADILSDNIETPRAYGGKVEEEPLPTSKPVEPNPVTEAQAKVLEQVSFEGEKKIPATWEDYYTRYIDSLNPIRVTEEIATGEGLKPATESPYILERLTRGIFGKGQHFIRYGTFDFDSYKIVGKSYEEIMKPVEHDLNGFRAYMIAKRAVEVEGQGKASGVDLTAAREVVSKGRGKYETSFKDRLKYRDSLLSYMEKSGILSSDAVASMREANKDYVPFYRVFEGETRPTGASTVRNPIKAMKGSTRKIIDPIESDIKDTFLFLSLAEKNAARQAFVSLGPNFAERQPANIRPIKLTEPEIEKMFDEFLSVKKKTSTTRTETSGPAGVEGSKAYNLIRDRVLEALRNRGFSEGETQQMVARLASKDASSSTAATIIKEIQKTEYIPEIDIRLSSEAATVFRAFARPTAKDEIAVFTEGKREIYKVNPDVAEAFNATDKTSSGFLMNMLNTPAVLLRAGTVLSPDFFMRNIIRDAVSSFIYAGSNPIKTVRGAVSVARQDTAFQNWLKGGGANATLVAIDRDYIHAELFRLNAETGIMSRAWNVITKPVQILQATSELLENATRVGAVRSDLMNAKNKAAIQAAAYISREATVDFYRHGSDPAFQTYTRMAAFMNPGLQGLDRMFREIKNNPEGVLAKGFVSITIPSLLLWWANHDDPRYKNIPRWQKDLFHIVLTDKHIYRLPKTFELGLIFGTVPERLMDAFFTDNPDAIKDLDKSMMHAFAPNLIPTFIAPVIEQEANRSLFTGNPIVPTRLEELLPEYQYNDYTTETAKALGRILGAFPGMTKKAVSDDTIVGGIARSLTTPALIENYLRSWTGGLGTYALTLADTALRKSGTLPDPVKPTATLADIPFVKAFTIRYPSASAQSIQDFLDTFTAKKRVYNTIIAKAQEGDIAAVNKSLKFDPTAMVQLDDIRETMTQHSQLIHMIYKDPEMSASDKRQLIDTISFRVLELAEYGNSMLNEVEKATEK